MFSEIPLPFQFLGRNGISTYSILLMIAFLTASFLAPRELRRRGLNPEAADYCLLIAVVGAIVGSKVFFVFEIWNRIWIVDTGFWDTFYEVFFTWDGMADRYPVEEYGRTDITGMWQSLFSGAGLVFYGGFAFAFTGIYLYLRRKGYSVWRYGDAFMPALALGYAIGRLGCFVSGDGCFGHGAAVNLPLLTWVYGPAEGCVSDPNAWWQPYLCTGGVRVWNTPVLESIFSFGLFLFFTLWARKQAFRPGMLIAIFLVFNGIIRLLVEFLRINDAVIPVLDPPSYQNLAGSDLHRALGGGAPSAAFFQNWHWYGFTQSQLVGVVIAAIGFAWMFLGKLYVRDDQALADAVAESEAASSEKPAKKETQGGNKKK